MPLFDLIEKLYNIFQLNRLNEQSAYVCTFYDQVNDYLANNTGDIDDFVTEWNENIHRKTIQSNEINGIRLITIHKSKGLEFDILRLETRKIRFDNLVFAQRSAVQRTTDRTD